MAELILETGPRTGTKVTLSADEPCTIGRAGDNRVILDDPAAAPHHCVVKALKDGGFGIKALGGPLRVNGADLQAARLTDGDRLELGATQLRYHADGQRAAAPERMLGGFRLLDVLGKGGMGIVYRAEQVSLHREVALKVLSKELTSDPVFVARFVAEARAAARLSHPNVVQVFDVDRDGDTYFYSMELMAAGSLEDRLRRDKKIPVDEALGLIRDAARGLAYAESLRIVHRDIKPDNLMLDQHGHVKIADLGLAQTDEEQHGKLLGTPHFMAPEQALRRPLDHRTDLYALGCTFYRLVTGRTPFQGATSRDILRAQVQETAEPPHKVEPTVPPVVGGIVERLLEKDPAERYQSANELIADLDELLAPAARRGIWIAAAIAAVVVAAIALVFALREREPTVITKETVVTDPLAAKLQEEMRQKDAELARLSVEARGLQDAALAAALEEMAAAHPDTDAARTAQQRAGEIRAELDRRAKAAAARAQAIRELVTSRTEAVRAALGRGELTAALAAADAEVPAELTDASEVTKLRTTLRDEIAAVAKDRIGQLREALASALAERREAAIPAARDALQQALQQWPEALVPQRAEHEAQLAAADRLLGELAAARQAELEQAAWQRFAAAWTGPDSVLAAVQQWDFARAAERARAAAADTGDGPAAAHAAQLATAAEAAAAYWQRFQAAIAAGNVQLNHGAEAAPRQVVSFTPTGDDAGVVVRVDPRVASRTERVPTAQLGDSEWLDLLLQTGEDTPGKPQQAAFLGLLALGEELRAARAYLGRVQPDDDQSGTGAGAHASRRSWLARAELALAGCPAGWCDALAAETTAAAALDRALRALSDKRNVSAHGHLSQLLANAPHTLLVLALR